MGKVRTFAAHLEKKRLFNSFKSKSKMKKLVFAIAAVVAISFASCGGNTQTAEVADSIAVDTVVEEAVVDSGACCCDSCAADTVVAE